MPCMAKGVGAQTAACCTSTPSGPRCKASSQFSFPRRGGRHRGDQRIDHGHFGHPSWLLLTSYAAATNAQCLRAEIRFHWVSVSGGPFVAPYQERRCHAPRHVWIITNSQGGATAIWQYGCGLRGPWWQMLAWKGLSVSAGKQPSNPARAARFHAPTLFAGRTRPEAQALAQRLTRRARQKACDSAAWWMRIDAGAWLNLARADRRSLLRVAGGRQ